MIQSHSLIFSDFETPWYKHWAKELKQNKQNLDSHKPKANKFWQNAVIAQALYERGKLSEGSCGIGFGVGRERLPAVFAKYDVRVTATDQDFTTEKARHWDKHELAKGTESLNRLKICSPKKFAQNVSYESVDMTKIPKKFINKYDFVWSNCALGHLGSIEAGLNFIVESAKYLKKGGVAVHTTELNVVSNSTTLDNHPETVIFRPHDIYLLSKRLRAEGVKLSHLKLNFGDTKEDHAISIVPKFGNSFSKLQVGGHLITQIVLVMERTGNPSMVHGGRNYLAYKTNRLKQKQFAKKHPLLQSIKKAEEADFTEEPISITKSKYNVKLSDKPAYVYLEFQNNSEYPFFSAHNRIHTTKPLVLGTSNPIDRKSMFIADDWFNQQANRPSTHLCRKNGKTWENIEFIEPHSPFAFRLKLSRNKAKPGKYTENFILVHEGSRQFSSTEVSVTIAVS